MKEIRCTIVRGGSSKGVFFERNDLPAPGRERDKLILSVFGSPDPRQIDGLGGADKLTSKTAVIGLPTRDDCDIDYQFGQVNITLPKIDWASNCGNISAGAAAYSVHKGYVKGKSESVRVAIHQVNTGRRLVAIVPLQDGQFATHGNFEIGGVPGTGARIDLDFQDFGGCILNKGILPTGNPVDEFNIPNLGKIEISIIDMANLCLFVRASDVGLDHLKSLAEIQADHQVVSRLESIRAIVAEELDYIKGENAAENLLISMNPLLFIMGTPRSYQAINGERIDGEKMDLFARSITRALFSKTYPGSGSIATAVSCGIPNTITSQLLSGGNKPSGEPYGIRVGHPSGTLDVHATVKFDDKQHIFATSAVIGRTARILMEGKAFIK